MRTLSLPFIQGFAHSFLKGTAFMFNATRLPYLFLRTKCSFWISLYLKTHVYACMYIPFSSPTLPPLLPTNLAAVIVPLHIILWREWARCSGRFNEWNLFETQKFLFRKKRGGGGGRKILHSNFLFQKVFNLFPFVMIHFNREWPFSHRSSRPSKGKRKRRGGGEGVNKPMEGWGKIIKGDRKNRPNCLYTCALSYYVPFYLCTSELVSFVER